MGRILALLILLALAVLGLSFAVLNAEPVPVNYYFGTRELPLALTLVLALALGAVLGVAASMAMVIRLRREAARLRRQARMAEKEVMNLRAIPLKDSH